MRVALNLLFLHPRAGGVGTAAREVIPRMLEADPALRLVLLTGPEADPIRAGAAWADDVEWVRSPVTVTHGPPGNFVRSIGTQWLVQPWQARRRRMEVLHGLANMGAVVAPGVATVTTIHDLIWMAHPDSMSPRDRFGTRWTTIPAARAADLVITDSAAARDVVLKRLRLRPERVVEVPLGASPPPMVSPDAAGVRSRLGLGDAPVLLCVSQKRPHKNLEVLVGGLALLGRPEVRLVIPGAPTDYEDRLRTMAVAAGVGDALVLPDWLEPEELEGLYATARGVVLPSLEEGFGLPVLEAMSRGAPVACSAVSALAEVAGDAALRFDPTSPEAVALAMACLLDDEPERERLRAAGAERVGAFRWDRTARSTLAAYATAMERRRTLSWDRGVG